MRRRKLLGLLLGYSAAEAATEVGSQEYQAKLLQFNLAYGEFFRDYFGCPPHAAYAEECTLGSGHVNYAAYLRSWRLAKEVFPQ